MFIVWQYMVMSRAHKDKSPHRFRLCCVIWLSALGAITLNLGLQLCDIADMFNYVYLGGILIGLPLIAFKLDKATPAEDMPGGSACCLVLAAQMMAVFVFMIAGGSAALDARALSGVRGGL